MILALRSQKLLQPFQGTEGRISCGGNSETPEDAYSPADKVVDWSFVAGAAKDAVFGLGSYGASGALFGAVVGATCGEVAGATARMAIFGGALGLALSGLRYSVEGSFSPDWIPQTKVGGSMFKVRPQ